MGVSLTYKKQVELTTFIDHQKLGSQVWNKKVSLLVSKLELKTLIVRYYSSFLHKACLTLIDHMGCSSKLLEVSGLVVSSSCYKEVS